jgi:hypothetical protein
MTLYFSERGMALMAVLIFLEVFSVLGLFALQGNLRESQLTHRFWAKSLMASAAKVKLTLLERQFNSGVSTCQIAQTPAPVLVRHALAWWQSVSCVGIFRSFQYYYVIEFLGNDPCAYLAGFDAEPAASVGYYRMSLLMLRDPNSGQRLILQSSIAAPVMHGAICKTQRHRVLPGRQMLRELS